MSVMRRRRAVLGPRTAILLVVGIVEALAFGQACGGDDAAAPATDAGVVGTGGYDPGQSGGDPGGDPGGGPGGDPDPGTAGDILTDPVGGDAGPVSNAPEFEGIDIDLMTMAATPGCAGGFDASTGTLTLTVEGTTRSLLIDATDGNVRANAVVCTSLDGTPLTPADVNALVVHGTEADENVVLDLLPGDFGAMLTKPAAFQFDLGDGIDTVRIRATRGDDRMSCAGTEGGVMSTVQITSAVDSLHLGNVESLVVSLGPGNDSFSGAGALPCAVPLVVYGGAGSDALAGGEKDDVLNGGEDVDSFDMGSVASGADIVNGGPGEDFVSYALRMRGVTIRLCSSSAVSGCALPDCVCQPTSGETNEHDTIVNVESAEGGEGDDAIYGDDNANALLGNGGNDHIEGLGGADQLYGNDGDDTLYGGDDDDILSGGAGTDTFDGEGGNNICLYDTKDGTRKNCNLSVLTD